MRCESCKLPIILLVSIIILLPCVRSQDQTPHECIQNGNYTSNSTYSTNLNTSLSSLSTNMGNNGFNNASAGRSPDTVNAIALCRTDRTLAQCRTCVQNAVVGLLQLCPNQRQAIIWNEFCMIRYSDEPIYGTQTNDPDYILLNTRDVANPNQFRDDRARLLDDLRAQAANGSAVMKGSAGSRNTSDSEMLYGLVQCTPDLSADECDNCLVRAGQSIRSCCDTARGVRVLLPSCNIRYELYSFYNETRLQEFQALLPPAPSPPAPLPPATSPSPPGSGDDNTSTIIIIIVVIVVVCLILAACCTIFLRKRIKRGSHEILQTIESDENSTVESLQYDFGKIRDATNDFADSNKLGEGGFGAVYKGKLPNGQEIAVKRLSKDSGQGNMEFKNEVLLVARLQHRNLVRLLGFSVEGTERLLIYEFVQNSSLDQFIFDPTKRSYLDWNSCYKIIEGIARGLLYLHEDSQLRIIHRDLKTSNILLDKEMNPKIADFGMARLFAQDETQGTTNRIVGTYGYMSPEYAMHGQFSPKSDVFSFGVLVLEILSGRKNSYTQNQENVEDLLSFVWKNWSEGVAANVIDPVLRASTNSMRDMLRCVHMGLLCVQENAIDRPTMASIVLMLNSNTITLPVPKQPAFFVDSVYGPNISYDSKESNSSNASKAKVAISEGSSRNSMSVTELYPR